MPDEFAQFEHQSWQRVANLYEESWSNLTRSFIPALLAAVNIRSGVRVLDVACGPGYVSEAILAAGGTPLGIDFSSEMIRLARQRNAKIEFREGDAQALDFPDASFDVVTMNFGILHLSDPEKAISESRRVLRPGGRYGFTVWADATVSLGARIVETALTEYAEMEVGLPKGPDYFAYSRPDECLRTLLDVGFDGSTFDFQTEVVQWQVPTETFLFEVERDAGVRTAALLQRQRPEMLDLISRRIALGVAPYANDRGYAIPFAAHIVTIRTP
ncbi:MAG: class I SAM-dependent methyltransferase [Pyrinomonadaceae bacterium]